MVSTSVAVFFPVRIAQTRLLCSFPDSIRYICPISQDELKTDSFAVRMQKIFLEALLTIFRNSMLGGFSPSLLIRLANRRYAVLAFTRWRVQSYRFLSRYCLLSGNVRPIFGFSARQSLQLPFSPFQMFSPAIPPFSPGIRLLTLILYKCIMNSIIKGEK